MAIHSVAWPALRVICRWQGSVLPQSAVMALPSTALAILLHILFKTFEVRHLDYLEGIDEVWAGYTLVLGFLIVFRSSQAYSRYWDGARSLQSVRAEWFQCFSNLCSWCSTDADRTEEVKHFQTLLARLFSMLHCSGLQEVCDLSDDALEIIDLRGIETASLRYLETATDRCEVICNWIQRLITKSAEEGLLQAQPPVVQVSYQFLSRGMVSLSHAKTIAEVEFPFPYAQMVTIMLLVENIMTPFMACKALKSWWLAGVLAFLVTSAMWSLVHIATEIDQPFGEDANDLPIHAMQRSMNASLLQLLHMDEQEVPTFAMPHTKENSEAFEYRIVRSDLYYCSREPSERFAPVDSRRSKRSSHGSGLYSSGHSAHSGVGSPRSRLQQEQHKASGTNFISASSSVVAYPGQDGNERETPQAPSTGDGTAGGLDVQTSDGGSEQRFGVEDIGDTTPKWTSSGCLKDSSRLGPLPQRATLSGPPRVGLSSVAGEHLATVLSSEASTSQDHSSATFDSQVGGGGSETESKQLAATLQQLRTGSKRGVGLSLALGRLHI